jgi:hypothetical protein
VIVDPLFAGRVPGWRHASAQLLFLPAFHRGQPIQINLPAYRPFSIVYEKLISPEWRDAATTDARGQLRLVWVKIHCRGCSVARQVYPRWLTKFTFNVFTTSELLRLSAVLPLRVLGTGALPRPDVRSPTPVLALTRADLALSRIEWQRPGSGHELISR